MRKFAFVLISFSVLKKNKTCRHDMAIFSEILINLPLISLLISTHPLYVIIINNKFNGIELCLGHYTVLSSLP